MCRDGWLLVVAAATRQRAKLARSVATARKRFILNLKFVRVDGGAEILVVCIQNYWILDRTLDLFGALGKENSYRDYNLLSPSAIELNHAGTPCWR